MKAGHCPGNADHGVAGGENNPRIILRIQEDWIEIPKAHTFTEGGDGTSSSGLDRYRWGSRRWGGRAGVRETRPGFGYRSVTPRPSKRRLAARERVGLANPATLLDGRRLSDRGRPAIQPQSGGPGSDCRFGGGRNRRSRASVPPSVSSKLKKERRCRLWRSLRGPHGPDREASRGFSAARGHHGHAPACHRDGRGCPRGGHRVPGSPRGVHVRRIRGGHVVEPWLSVLKSSILTRNSNHICTTAMCLLAKGPGLSGPFVRIGFRQLVRAKTGAGHPVI